MTADAACTGIREHDPDGRSALVGADSHAPYKRPPLTKGLWKGDRRRTSIWRETGRDSASSCVSAAGSSRSTSRTRSATDDSGASYGYERLLLATGGRPRAAAGMRRTTSSTSARFDDYRRLRGLADAGAALPRGRRRIHRLRDRGRAGDARLRGHDGLPGATASARASFRPSCRAAVTDYYREKGVDVLDGRPVEASSGRRRDGESDLGGRPGARRRRGRRRPRDRAGRRARGRGAASTVDDGIVVDEYGRAAAATRLRGGRRRRFPQPALGPAAAGRARGPRQHHGRAVGANMAGAGQPYDHLPFFYSDLFDLGYEAVGDVDSRAATRRRLEGAEPQGRRRLRRRRGSPARLPALGRLGQGRRRARPDPGRRARRRGSACRDSPDQTSSSVRAASSRSRSVIPPAEWVVQRTRTRRYRMSMSGWWFSASASSRGGRRMRSPRGTTNSNSRSARRRSRSSLPRSRDQYGADGELRRSRKPRHGTELLCEYVFRPAAHSSCSRCSAARPAAGGRARRQAHRARSRPT